MRPCRSIAGVGPLVLACLLGLGLFAAARAEEGQLQAVLTGIWTGTAPDGTEISYTFSKDGKVIWRVKEKDFLRRFPAALSAKYQLRPAKPNWLLDVEEFKDPKFKDVRFLAIVEFEDRQTMKLEGKPSTEGERPTEFGTEAVLFRANKK